MENLYKDYDQLLDKLIKNNANDIQLNNFLEMCAYDDGITHDEYTELVLKAQETRRL